MNEDEVLPYVNEFEEEHPADSLASSQPNTAISIINPKNLGEIQDVLEITDHNGLASCISNQCWSPAKFKDKKRTMASLECIGLLVLDVDSGHSLADATVTTFKDFKHIIATSRNHQKEKNGVVCDRFRVVLFLDSEITNDKDFKATWETAYKRWPFIDRACKDSSRFFYPSPEIVSISDKGVSYPTSVAEAEPSIRQSSSPATGQNNSGGTKGELWKSTLKFLLEGAPAGTRHNELVKAVGNMREQGYDLQEVFDEVEAMSLRGDWTQEGLNENDIKTIERMFNREMKYPFTPVEPQKSASSVIVNASDLLDETFEYLADKDKVKGDPTGIEGLDKLLGGGFRTGELTVLMAQAKTGKNTLYHYMIYKHLERGMPFGYASRELNPATEVIPNLLSIALKTNAWTGDVSETFKTNARGVLSQWDLKFAPGYGTFAPADIERWLVACKEAGIDHFLFDHFHYALEGEDYEATAKLIKHLKKLTKELDIHLSLIVQPRSLREGEALSLATLRGGAAIGQALDNLLILERVRGEQNISRLKLDQARHKLATLGEIFLMYDKQTTGFTEVERKLVQRETPVPQGVSRRPGGWSGQWPRVT